MIQISSPTEMQAWSARERAHGARIAFVPTMGFLHEGHLSLVDIARQKADRIVLSIYVNPIQFGVGEDLEAYPRDLATDKSKAETRGCHVIFTPSDKDMYPSNHSTYVAVESLASGLCGFSRPGHFRGVTTVVMKLLNMVQPHAAVFGQKDAQQLAVVRRMVRDLDVPVEIVGAPIVREEDGLAMSSRNAYLSKQERQKAGGLYRSLQNGLSKFQAGERNADAIIASVRDSLSGCAPARIEYVAVVDSEEMAPVGTVQSGNLLAAACFIGTTRLIDNIVLELPIPQK